MNIEKNWWETVPQWQSSSIPSNSDRRGTGRGWAIFLLLLVVAGYILYDNQQQLLAHYYAREYSEMQELLVLLFPVLFLLHQLKRWRKRNRFGETPLLMNPFPALLGDKFSGVVDIHKKVEGLTFSAELLLLRQQETHYPEEDGLQIENHLQWRMPVSLNKEPSPTGIQLVLDAQLPGDKPSSQPAYHGDGYLWQLYIFSHDKTFKRIWDIPVISRQDYV